MLIFRSAVFLHVPKTGGSWVREAVTRAEIPFDEYLAYGDQHGDLSYCPCPSKFKFAFVRHPHGLYQSYWRFKMAAGWDARNPFDVDCRASTFDGFVQAVLAQYPGWCSRMYEDYVGPPDREIEFVGRFERLAGDLVRALRLAGEAFDERRLLETPRANASTWPAADAGWSPRLAAAVRDSEAAAFSRFGYASVP